MRDDFAAGQSRVRSALDHLRAAGDSADAVSLGVRARILLLRLGARTGMDVVEADRLFGEARSAVDRLADPAAMAALALADGAVRYWAGNAAGAVSSWSTAVQQADLTGNRSLQAFANLTLCAAHAYAGPLDLALGAAARTVELCAGDPLVGVDAAGYSSLDASLLARGLLGIEVGTLEQARLQLAESLAVYAERQSAEFRAWTLSVLARLADARGDVASAGAPRTAALEACALAADSGNIGIAVKGTIAVGVARVRRDRRDGARAADSRGAGIWVKVPTAERRRAQRSGCGEVHATEHHDGRST